jgi:competence ComEA-like helix-hairpin-helix protein
MLLNNKEIKGIVLISTFLLSFICIIWFRNYTFNEIKITSLDADDSLNIALHELKQQMYKDNEYKQGKSQNGYNNRSINLNEDHFPTYELSDFDPNTVNFNQLRKMGINERAINNWLKYLNKGGRFKKPEDLKKVFGLSPKTYEVLRQYVKISQTNVSIIQAEKKSDDKKSTFENQNVEKNNKIYDLNTSTSEELTELKGIGEVLSLRIVKYRDKLGGFVNIDQLKEVYGLPPETFENIKSKVIADPKMLKKIKVNLADEYILSGFPYISKRYASQIVNYRNQHGYFLSIDDLKKIRSLDEALIQKIEPYLDFRE